MESTLNMVFLGIDIFIVFILLLDIIKGLIRGVPRTMNKIVIDFLAAGLLLFAVNPVTDKILTEKVIKAETITYVEEKWDVELPIFNDLVKEGESYSAGEILATTVVNTIYSGFENVETEKAKALVQVIMAPVVKIIVYVVMLFLLIPLRMLLSIIFSILRKIFRIKLKRKHHLLGGLLGIVRYASSFVLIFLPLLGIISTVSLVADELIENGETLLASSEIETLTEVRNAEQESYITKYVITPLSKDEPYPITTKYLSKALALKDGKTEVSLIDEYYEIKKLFPTIAHLKNDIENGDADVILSKITDEDIDVLAGYIKNGSLVPLVLPAGVEAAMNLLMSSSNGLNIDKELLSSFDWKQELNVLSETLALLKELDRTKLDISDVSALLKNENAISTLRKVVAKFSESAIISKVAFPAAIGQLANKYSEIDFSLLESLDWSIYTKDLFNLVFDSLTTVLTLENLEKPLESKNVQEVMTSLFDNLISSQIATEVFVPFAVENGLAMIDKMEEFENINVDLTPLKTVDWKVTLPQIKELCIIAYNTYQTLGIGEEKNYLAIPELPSLVDSLVDKLLEIEFVNTCVLPFALQYGVLQLEKTGTLDKFGLDKDVLLAYDLTNELKSLKDAAVILMKTYQDLNIVGNNYLDAIDNPNILTYLEDLSEAILSSNLFKEEILPLLSNKLSEIIDQTSQSIDLSFAKNLVTEDKLITLLTDDLSDIVKVLQDAKKIGFLEGKLDLASNENQEIITEMVETLFGLSVMKGNEEQTFTGIINGLGLNENLKSLGITLDPTLVRDWEKEITILNDLIKNILAVSTDIANFDFSIIVSGESSEQLKAIINVVKDFALLDSTKDSIYTLLSNAIKSMDEHINLDFTAKEKLEIETQTGWDKEIETLQNVFKNVKEAFDDGATKENTDPDFVYMTMIEASNGVIASKIISIALNNLLGDEVAFKLSSRQDILDSASFVRGALEFTSVMTNADEFDLNSKEDVKTLINAIKNVADYEAGIEMANTLMNEALATTTPIEITKETLSAAADIIEIVINEYQECENQESFDYTKLSIETLEQLQESELGKAILNFFFE